MIVEKDIAQAILTTGFTTIYTVPAGTRLIIKTFDLCNTDRFVTIETAVHFVRPTASPTTSNMIVPDVDLEPRHMLQWTGLQVLPEGTTIQVKASALGVTINMSGAESTD